MMAADAIREPFAVINADDFYGASASAYRALAAGHLQSGAPDFAQPYAMVGFILSKTLSDFGSVARGICQADADGNLTSVLELLTSASNATAQAPKTPTLSERSPLSPETSSFP